MAELTDVKIQLGSEKFKADQIREFKSGDWIAREGDETREMYVVIDGKVVISKSGRGGSVQLAEVSRGGFVGEMSLLESLPRSASVQALTDVRVLVIQPGGFLLKIRRDPTFAFEIMQSLSSRIRRTNEALLKAIETGATSTESLRSIVNSAEASPPENESLK